MQRLKEYKARLIVFPRKAGKTKKGDSSAEEISNAVQLSGPIIPVPKVGDAVSFGALTEVIFCHSIVRKLLTESQTVSQELKNFKAYITLRTARTDASLVGVRMKKAKGGDKKDDVPVSKGGGDDQD